LLGLSKKQKYRYSSVAIQIITAGRLINMYAFICEKENQMKIEQNLTKWTELLIDSNKYLIRTFNEK